MITVNAKVEVVIKACIDADPNTLQNQSSLEDKVKHIIENEIDNVLSEQLGVSNYVEAKSKVVELKIKKEVMNNEANN